jgi:hypothetical protein
MTADGSWPATQLTAAGPSVTLKRRSPANGNLAPRERAHTPTNSQPRQL